VECGSSYEALNGLGPVFGLGLHECGISHVGSGLWDFGVDKGKSHVRPCSLWTRQARFLEPD
jgi:hypothetical protein